MTHKERALVLCQRLERTCPKVDCVLTHHSPFELLVSTILSAQCTDKQVDLVTQKLFDELRTVHAFADVPQERLESLIYSTGFYRNKAKNIRAAAKKIMEHYGGEVPKTLQALVTLPGVGRKTANVVLSKAFGKSEGVVVDTHVARLAKRLKLTFHVHPVQIERDLMKVFPKKHWISLSRWLIWHGRRCCTARKPNCATCQLWDICPGAFCS